MQGEGEIWCSHVMSTVHLLTKEIRGWGLLKIDGWVTVLPRTIRLGNGKIIDTCIAYHSHFY
jgi:hypothetical protein